MNGVETVLFVRARGEGGGGKGKSPTLHNGERAERRTLRRYRALGFWFCLLAL